MFSSFLIAVIALIAMLYYSLKYSYTSRLEIKYSGTLDLKMDRDFVESDVTSTNSSHKNSSIRASDKVYLFQENSRSKQSDQMTATGKLVTDSKNDRNRTSDNNVMNLSADGSVASHDKHKQNSSVKDDAKAGVASDGSNTGQDLEENICPKSPSTLVGPLYVNESIPKMEEVEKEMATAHGGWVSNGGCWKPTECKARVKMALIIPYRNRFEQLSIFVRHMHPILKRQNVDYRIFVVEQAGNTPFNRAILFNIGFNESLKFDQYECFIFHDVDLIPEDDRNEYTCPSSPRHMSVAVDKFNYRLPYQGIFGGAGSFTREHFELINGFSNVFWGWGGEDDDLFQRITAKGLKLMRPSMQAGRYKMLKTFHFRSTGKNPNRGASLRTSVKRMSTDGLNSLKYKVQHVKEYPLYTLVSVDVKDAM